MRGVGWLGGMGVRAVMATIAIGRRGDGKERLRCGGGIVYDGTHEKSFFWGG